MNCSLRRWVAITVVCCAAMMVCARPDAFAAPPEMLHLDVFIGEADSWGVTSTLIYGKSEAILVDSQLRISQAKKLADQVAATGRRLKAIIITHFRAGASVEQTSTPTRASANQPVKTGNPIVGKLLQLPESQAGHGRGIPPLCKERAGMGRPSLSEDANEDA